MHRLGMSKVDQLAEEWDPSSFCSRGAMLATPTFSFVCEGFMLNGGSCPLRLLGLRQIPTRYPATCPICLLEGDGSFAAADGVGIEVHIMQPRRGPVAHHYMEYMI
jgi:hypothetical protein